MENKNSYSVIENLFYDHVAVKQEESYSNIPGYLEAIDKASENERKLLESLDENNKKIFKDYVSAVENELSIVVFASFENGFRHGVSHIIDIMKK